MRAFVASFEAFFSFCSLCSETQRCSQSATLDISSVCYSHEVFSRDVLSFCHREKRAYVRVCVNVAPLVVMLPPSVSTFSGYRLSCYWKVARHKPQLNCVRMFGAFQRVFGENSVAKLALHLKSRLFQCKSD